jgi:hypothetical protein
MSSELERKAKRDTCRFYLLFLVLATGWFCAYYYTQNAVLQFAPPAPCGSCPVCNVTIVETSPYVYRFGYSVCCLPPRTGASASRTTTTAISISSIAGVCSAFSTTSYSVYVSVVNNTDLQCWLGADADSVLLQQPPISVSLSQQAILMAFQYTSNIVMLMPFAAFHRYLNRRYYKDEETAPEIDFSRGVVFFSTIVYTFLVVCPSFMMSMFGMAGYSNGIVFQSVWFEIVFTIVLSVLLFLPVALLLLGRITRGPSMWWPP